MSTGPQPVRPFASPVEMGKVVKGFFIATMVVCALSVVTSVLETGFLTRSLETGVDAAEALANTLRQGLVGVLSLAVSLGTGVVFLIWFHRAHANLPALGGRRLKYSPGWAVGGFFVPFLNFVRPAQVMTEIWHGSDPEGLERDTALHGPSARNKLEAPLQVVLWWGLHVGAGIIAYIGLRGSLFTVTADLEALRWSAKCSAAAEAVRVFGALVAIRVVTQVSAWQVARSQRILESGVSLAHLLGIEEQDLLPADAPSPKPVHPLLQALDELAMKRRRGEITEQEFQERKAEVLKARRTSTTGQQ